MTLPGLVRPAMSSDCSSQSANKNAYRKDPEPLHQWEFRVFCNQVRISQTTSLLDPVKLDLGGDIVETLKVLWHVPTVMITLLAAGLIMGQRHVGELSIFDLLTGIAIGAVAGAGIVNLDIPLGPVLLSIVGFAIFHYLVTFLMKKWPFFGRVTTYDPLIVVHKGKPLRSAMRKVQLSLSDLLPLLREKNIFDIREVEYGMLEPDGKLTVIKTKEVSPAKGLPRAVIVDGYVEEKVLNSLGWSKKRLADELQRLGHPNPEQIFLATLSESGEFYAVPKDPFASEPKIRH